MTQTLTELSGPVAVDTRHVARVLFRCPVQDCAVPTGFRMNAAKLEVDVIRHSFRCGACEQIHQWGREDAWLELGRR